MNRFLCAFLFLLSGALLQAQQATVPVVSQALPNRTLVAGGPEVSIHLSDYFAVPGVSGTVVQFDTVKGKFNAEMFDVDAPKTVANFLGYIGRGAYTNGIVHRSVPGFVIQGGAYTVNNSSLTPVPTVAPVQNEFKNSNTRGMIAMAKVGGDPNSATSQWFVNLANNADSLDSANGGYTVFARVLGSGMSVVDAIASVPVYNHTDIGPALGELPLLNPGATAANLVMVNSIRVVPVYPDLAHTSSVLSFSGGLSAGGVVNAETAASTLTIRPIGPGSTTISLRATDTNGNFVDASFTVNVVGAPLVTTPPASQAIAAGGNSTLGIAATGSPTFAWQRNGATLPNIASATVSITNMQPSIAGLYTATASSAGVSTVSQPAILGVTTTSKVIGGGSEVGTDIPHPNGNIFDQVLITGSSAAFTSDHTLNQVTRASFIDLQDDIVQVEFSGPGTVSIFLDAASGPATPVKYTQPTVSYVKGHATIVVSGADERSNLSIFSVGRATAFDPTGAYNILQAPSDTNIPANNGSPLFNGQAATTYDGFADLARIAIISTNGKFGGVRAANANFYDVQGFTGIYAPGVTFQGPVFVGNIKAFSTASPGFVIGAALDETRITGGDLAQPNGQPLAVAGLTQLKFTQGSDSRGNILPAKFNQGILRNNGANVTAQIVVNPQ